MFYVRLILVAVIFCLISISGINAKRMSLVEDLTVLIDYPKYRRVQNQRAQRQLNPWNKLNVSGPFGRTGSLFPLPWFPSSPQQPAKDRSKDDCDECEHIVCDDPVNEVYQSCGSKCVLGCRYATTSSGFTVSKHDCDKNECVEGCFCKTGLVRHQTKCIHASECPVRKCNHRYEVYMCGPAAPITCDNALRGEEIMELTRYVDCVWGCYCAQGYLRNNYNGKCVVESECRNTKSVDISPQIPGLFKHVTNCPGGNGCPCDDESDECDSEEYSSSEEDCGPIGCKTNNENAEQNDESNGAWANPFNPNAAFVSGVPVWGWSGQVTHYHHFNDSTVGTTGGPGPSGYPGPYSDTGELPFTSISLENGTTITIPIIPGTQIDVATGTVNADEIEAGRNEEGDTEPQNGEYDKVEEAEESSRADQPKDEKSQGANAVPPQTQPITDDTNAMNIITPTSNAPSTDASSAIEPTTTTAPAKPHIPPNNGPPNNGAPNPFVNPFLQYPQFPFNNYPNAQPFAGYPNGAAFSGYPNGFPYPPPNFYNQPVKKKPQRGSTDKLQPHTERVSDSSQEDTEDNSEEDDEDGNDSGTDDQSNGSNTMSSSNTPQKNTANMDQTKNGLPPNYPQPNPNYPYWNYFNSFNPNQYYPIAPNALNGAKKPNAAPQFNQFASNPQFNQFNPQNFQPPLNNYNPQYNVYPSQKITSSSNKKTNNKSRPPSIGNQPVTPSTFKYSYNRKVRPSTNKDPKPQKNDNLESNIENNVDTVVEN